MARITTYRMSGPHPGSGDPARGHSGPRVGLARMLCILGLAGMTLTAFAAGKPGPGTDPSRQPRTQLAALTRLAGTDPARALAQAATVRDAAVRAGLLDVRLAVDEVECRLLRDLDVSRAERTAEAGIAIGQAAGDAAPQLPWLRLKICHAATLLMRGDQANGLRELDEVLAASKADALVSAHALALMERGTYRSRGGDMPVGQQDLLKACEMLKAPDLDHDLDLCLGSLANHHKRIGDLDEAMLLYKQLIAKARAQAARFDESIYAYGIAEVLFHRADWPKALAAFQDVATMAHTLGDPAGQAYAELGIGATLGRQAQPAKALPHVELALRLLDASADPGHALRARITRAKLLTQLGRAQESAMDLKAIEPQARAMNQQWLMAIWLSAHADAAAALGQWPVAYQALQALRAIEEGQQQQRLSEATMRLRLQFAREYDIAELRALRQVNEQGDALRQTQRLVIALILLLLLASGGFALLKLMQSRSLRSLASTDELTGLLNRRSILAYAEHQLQRAVEHGTRLSVLMIDIDNFKRINDEQGHAAGDAVLRRVGRILPTALRTQDRLGRIGGEEFLVILPEAALGQATAVAHRIREAVAASPLSPGEGAVPVTVSIGVAEWLAQTEGIDGVMSRADAALYLAKTGGRNAVEVDGAAPGAARSVPA
jgi:diguanylate cyclase (GGDEF)-like protein